MSNHQQDERMLVAGKKSERARILEEDHVHERPSSLDLGQHVLACIEYQYWLLWTDGSAADYLSAEVANDGSEAAAELLTTLWNFARRLKGHWEMIHLSGMAALEHVRGALALLPDPPQGDDRWKEYLGLDETSAETEFCYAYDNVNSPAGFRAVDRAIDRAETEPLAFPASLRDRRPEAYYRFIGVCGWLQVLVGNRPIGLSCDYMARRMGVAKNTVWVWRSWAVEDDLLRIVEKVAPGRRGKATQYLVRVALFPALKAEAAPGVEDSFASLPEAPRPRARRGRQGVRSPRGI